VQSVEESCYAAVVTAFFLMMLHWSAFGVDGINLPGPDYDSFDAPSATVCCNTCGGEGRCQAYTWVKPGIQGPNGRCWLRRRSPRWSGTAAATPTRGGKTLRGVMADGSAGPWYLQYHQRHCLLRTRSASLPAGSLCRGPQPAAPNLADDLSAGQ